MNPLTRLGAQGLAKTATAAVIAGGLVWVSLGNLPAATDTTLPSLPGKNVAAWTMPLDRYIIVDPNKENYAEQLLQKKCLATQGYTWSVPWQDVASLDTQPDSGSAADVPKPLSVKQATANGYHSPGDDGLSASLWRRFASTRTTSKDELSAFDTCLDGTRTQLPLTYVQGISAEISDRAITLARTAIDEAHTDPRVIATEIAWRSCMAPAHIVDLPSSPTGMPTPTMRLNSRAHQIARRDAACQATSGYRSALYAAQYSRETQVSSADAKLFAKMPTGRPAFEQKVDRTIAQLIPPAPKL